MNVERVSILFGQSPEYFRNASALSGAGKSKSAFDRDRVRHGCVLALAWR